MVLPDDASTGWTPHNAGRTLTRILPWFALPTDLDGSLLSKDPGVGEAYASDPRISKKVTARWFSEVMAAHRYGLTLLPASTKGHDAKTRSGKLVQIKATQGKRVALRSRPKHLIVLELLPNGKTEEAYNGPGHRVWNRAGKMQKNGQRPVSLSRLAQLMKTVPSNATIRARRA